MLHLFAALAEKERAMISSRTRVALEAAKAKGQKLGNPNLAQARVTASESRAKVADDFAAGDKRRGLTVLQPRWPCGNARYTLTH